MEKQALRDRLQIEEGDLILFAADEWEIACEADSAVCVSRIAELQRLTNAEQLDFLWVTDFPLLQRDARPANGTRCTIPLHDRKPRTCPLLEEKRYGEVRAEAYDVVLNGVEIGGGSIRIHERDLQAKMCLRSSV